MFPRRVPRVPRRRARQEMDAFGEPPFSVLAARLDDERLHDVDLASENVYQVPDVGPRGGAQSSKLSPRDAHKLFLTLGRVPL